MTVRIRPAVAADGEALRAIEVAAGDSFRAIGMGEIADHEPASVAELAAYADDGRSWVAVAEEGDGPIGYVLADVVDGNAHIEQVSVRPDRQARGLGRALVDTVDRWAAATGRPLVTLTTFRAVPWNMPLYAHLGFEEIPDAEIGPELRALVAVEAGHGLDPALRVCMRRPSGLVPRGDDRVEIYRPQ